MPWLSPLTGRPWPSLKGSSKCFHCLNCCIFFPGIECSLHPHFSSIVTNLTRKSAESPSKQSKLSQEMPNWTCFWASVKSLRTHLTDTFLIARDRSLCGICEQKMTDGTSVTEFIAGWAYKTGDLGFHGQVAIKCNSKVLDRVRQGNRCTTYRYKVWEGKREKDLDFQSEDIIIASVLSSFSLSLFSVIQDLMSSIHCCIERKRSGIWWGGADFWSWVISVRVMNDGVLFNYSRKRSCLENEKDRSKDWSLWNTERDGSWLGCVAMDADRLSAVCKVGWKPVEGRALSLRCIFLPFFRPLRPSVQVNRAARDKGHLLL